MPYVDGFVVPVPRDRIDEYERVAREAAEVWLEHGALSVTECLADDVPQGELTSFPRAVKPRTTRPSSFPGSSASRARRAMRSTKR